MRGSTRCDSRPNRAVAISNGPSTRKRGGPYLCPGLSPLTRPAGRIRRARCKSSSSIVIRRQGRASTSLSRSRSVMVALASPNTQAISSSARSYSPASMEGSWDVYGNGSGGTHRGRITTAILGGPHIRFTVADRWSAVGARAAFAYIELPLGRGLSKRSDARSVQQESTATWPNHIGRIRPSEPSDLHQRPVLTGMPLVHTEGVSRLDPSGPRPAFRSCSGGSRKPTKDAHRLTGT